MLNAADVRRMWDLAQIQTIKRDSRDRITAITRYAPPDSIASPHHRTATVVHVLPSTYTHRSSLAMGL